MTREEIKDVLGLWYYQELFTALKPDAEKVILNSEDLIDWESLDYANPEKFYRVYAGSLGAEFLKEISSRENKHSKVHNRYEEYGPLYTLCIDKNGNYIEDSFTVSYSVWALAKVAGDKNAELDLEELHSLNSGINQELIEAKPVFTASLIRKLNNTITKLLFDSDIHVNTHVYKLLTESDPSNPHGKSSNIEILKNSVNSVGKNSTLGKFVSAILNASQETADLTDPKLWQENLKPYDYANTAWPNKATNSTSEQWIINDIHKSHSNDIKNYQMPRGTNRARIVANVTAQNIYKRALLLNKLYKPGDAFTMRKFTYSRRLDSSNYYAAMFNLSKANQLLVSDNTRELNLINDTLNDAKEISNNSIGTSFDLSRNPEVYFTAASDAFAKTKSKDKKTWGLVSAHLDTHEDLQNLVDVLIEELDANSEYWVAQKELGHVYTFAEAKKKFIIADDKVNEKLAKANSNYESSAKFMQVLDEYDDLLEAQEALFSERELLAEEVVKAESNIDRRVEEIELRQEEIDRQLENISFWKKIIYRLFNYGDEARILNNMQENQNEAQSLLDISKNSHAEIINEQEDLRNELNRVKENIREKIQLIEELELIEKENKAKYGKNYIDRDSYVNIASAEYKSFNPWVDDELLALRENLLKASLDLQKSFILNSNEIHQNLKRLKLHLSGFYQGDDLTDSWQDLFSTLQMIIPNISMSRELLNELFTHAKSEESGCVIYLEAETNRPSELVPVLSVADRAIVLADFLQLANRGDEPLELGLALAQLTGVNASFVNPDYSAADYSLGNSDRLFMLAGEGIPFPVREQSRMIEPLHSIHNEICLDSLLFGKSIVVEPNGDDLLEQSSWPNIRTETFSGSLFSIQAADMILGLLKNNLKSHESFPDMGIAFFYSDVLAEWLEYSAQYIASEQDLNISEDEFINWISENSFLLTQWGGQSYDEVIFFAGGGSEEDREAVDLFSKDIKPLHTLFSTVKRNLLVLAAPELWAQDGKMQELHAKLDELGAKRNLKHKEINFVTMPENIEFEEIVLERDLNSDNVQDKAVDSNSASVEEEDDVEEVDGVNGQSFETDSSEDELEEVVKELRNEQLDQLRSAGIDINADSYYVADFNHAKQVVIYLTNENDDENIIIDRRISIENMNGDGRFSTVVKRVLDELERLSQNKATLFISKEWLNAYIEEKNSKIDKEKFKDIDIVSIEELGSVYCGKYYRFLDEWKLSTFQYRK